MSDSPSIGLITLSAIADDPRVRRQGDAFSAAGWQVIGVGVAGAVSSPPSWFVDDKVPALDWSRSDSMPLVNQNSIWSPLYRALSRRRRQIEYVFRMQAPRFSYQAAERVYWAQNSRYKALYTRALQYHPQIWLANDWNTLPVAMRLVEEQGGILIYDTHELASEEYSKRLLWRLLHRPLAMRIERQGLGRAHLVTCVSEGIADRLRATYRLRERPLVVCNMPSYQEMPYRPTGERIDVLYHGVVSPGRGLEECIRSVASWRPDLRLTIRGPAGEAYRAELEREVAAAGVGGRVRIVPPVPMTELVREANASDIGICISPDTSWHNRLALPNKFFEYAMAGLALCISDLPEMARLLRLHDMGVLVDGVSPEAIAKQVNALDRNMIDRYKRNALLAARQLNWEKECGKLVTHCSSLVTGHS